MNPPRPVVDLRSRDWRVALKAALDVAFGAAESVPHDIDAMLKGLK